MSLGQVDVERLVTDDTFVQAPDLERSRAEPGVDGPLAKTARQLCGSHLDELDVELRMRTCQERQHDRDECRDERRNDSDAGRAREIPRVASVVPRERPDAVEVLERELGLRDNPGAI